MMMLAKLKAVAVLAVTALALTTGLGLGLLPAAADDASAPRSGAPTTKFVRAAPAPAADPAPATRPEDRSAADPNADDATFLRRLCLDVRGTPPTDVEMWLFLSDTDADKRAKVVDWITDDEKVKQFIAKKLGIPPDRVKVVRARLSADGKFVEVRLEEPAERVVRPVKIAFDPDGNKLAVEGVVQVYDADAVARTRQTATDRLISKKWATKVQPKGAPTDVTTVWELLAAEPPVPGGSEISFHIVTLAPDAQAVAPALADLFVFAGVPADSDAEFLKRVLTDVRGSGPTALETKYFTEDKDPKKREKLRDTLLKDPAVQKKLGDAWKAKMLALKPVLMNEASFDILRLLPDGSIRVAPQPPQPPVPPQPPRPPMVVKPFTAPVPPPIPPAPPAPQADKFEKLVGELIAAKKSDEAILEALTLATLSRLPTDSEKKLALAGVRNAADRKVAWVAVARALAGADDKPTPIKVKVVVPPVPPLPPKPPVPPVPPARP